jgi:TRAP-type C4-dicarboxylate transport system permease small subunit
VAKIISFLKRLDVYIATTFMLFAFINVLLQIFSRIMPVRVVPWTVEMGEILLVAIIWMGIGLGVLNNTHVRFDLLLTQMPHKQKKFLYVLGNIVFAAFLLMLAFYARQLLQFHIRANNITPSLRWNRAIIRAPVLIGCVIGAVRLLIQAWFFATEKVPLPIDEEIGKITDAAEIVQKDLGEKAQCL